MDKKFMVYKHTFPNGKVYIGITSKKKPNQRWESGIGYSKNQIVMYNAIQKYGWDNIKHEILFENLSKDDACKKEIELIKKYHSFIHDPLCNGYNMTMGGDGIRGKKFTKEQKAKMSKSRTGKRGKLCCNSKPVICDGKIYESIIQFCEINNLERSMVQTWLCGVHKMPKEWFDKGLKMLNGEDKRIQEPQLEPHSKGIIYQNQYFKSQAQFAEFLNVSPSIVTMWLQCKRKVPFNIYKNGIYDIDGNKYTLIHI